MWTLFIDKFFVNFFNFLLIFFVFVFIFFVRINKKKVDKLIESKIASKLQFLLFSTKIFFISSSREFISFSK